MRNRRWICLLLAVLMVLACTACGAKTNDGASGDMRTLTDGKNRTVEVPKQVERVVASASARCATAAMSVRLTAPSAWRIMRPRPA